MSLSYILSRINKVFSSCTTKRQLKYARRYCHMLVDKELLDPEGNWPDSDWCLMRDHIHILEDNTYESLNRLK